MRRRSYEEPIPISELKLDLSSVDVPVIRNIVSRGFNKNQLLILKEIRCNIGRSLTSILRDASRRYGIPLSTLKLNAKILKDLNILKVDNGGSRGVYLTPLGEFVCELLGITSYGREFSVDPKLIQSLNEKASLVRKHVLEMMAEAGSGHVGASLSVVDVLVALYFAKMRYDPKNPSWPLRDRLILSEGHAAPALYAVLALAGFIPTSELYKLRDINNYLSGHPEIIIPGVDMISGSLGQGLSVGCGMALALKRDGINSKVYVILGDGELDEGQVWEAALTASKYKLNNLVAIVDRNRYQQGGLTEHIKPLEPLAMKWIAFGWHVIEVNGHDFRELLRALNEVDYVMDKPSAIIAHTIKGKGYPPAEGNNDYHNKPISKDELRLWGFK